MATNISIDVVQTKLREIIAELGPDDVVVITQDQRPVAKLVGSRRPSQRPGPGLCKEMITIVSDDDDHLEDFKEYMPWRSFWIRTRFFCTPWTIHD